MILLYPFIATFRFVSRWFKTREWRFLAYSLPAILIAGTIAASFLAYRSITPEVRAAKLTSQADQAMRNGDHENAEFLYRKVIRLQPDSITARYARACALNEMEQTDAAIQIMGGLAPLDGTDEGYVPAHLWLAQAIQDKTLDVPKEDRIKLITAHLRVVARKQPNNARARWALATEAIRTNRVTEALTHLPHVVETIPTARIVYARTLLFAKRPEDAKAQARLAMNFYDQQHERQPTARRPVQFWLDWTTAAVICKEFEQALSVLDDANARADRNEQHTTIFKQSAAQVLVQWTEFLEDTDPSSIPKQLELLANGLKIAPNSPALLARIAQLSGHAGDTEAIADSMLKQVLADGTAPGIVHFMLGTKAAVNDANSETAKRHLKQALRLDPNALATLNNLAWITASSENGDLEAALKLANQAVELNPSHPQVRDTRGQILIKLQRWHDGITDLELALQSLKSNPALHASLALAYTQIGDEQLANMHKNKQKLLATKHQP